MKTIFLNLLLILLFSCQTPITLEFEEFKPEIAVNCLFTNSQYFNVNINESKIIAGDNEFPAVNNARVFIESLKKGVLHELACHGEGNYFDSTFYPEFGEAYRLTVEVPGFEIMTATDSLPSPPVVTRLYCLKTDQLASNDFSGYKVTQQFISIYDNVDEKNYYELMAAAYMDFLDKYNGETLTSDDPVIINEHANVYCPGTLIFSDELFNGDSIKLLCNQRSYPPNDSTWHTRVTVISLSEKLYNNRKLKRRQQASSYDIVFPNEPIIMASGIENGYGIFAGFVAKEFFVYPSN